MWSQWPWPLTSDQQREMPPAKGIKKESGAAWKLSDYSLPQQQPHRQQCNQGASSLTTDQMMLLLLLLLSTATEYQSVGGEREREGERERGREREREWETDFDREMVPERYINIWSSFWVTRLLAGFPLQLPTTKRESDTERERESERERDTESEREKSHHAGTEREQRRRNLIMQSRIQVRLLWAKTRLMFSTNTKLWNSQKHFVCVCVCVCLCFMTTEIAPGENGGATARHEDEWGHRGAESW